MIVDERSARSWFSEALGVDRVTIARLDQFAAMLLEENQRQNLISRSSESEIWVRHLVDAAQLLIVPRETRKMSAWLDLGTGAGFPGVVIALCRPDIITHLVDSRRLRAEWLSRVAQELGLTNTIVHHSRVEALPALCVDAISARAFAPLEKLLRISARFSTPDTLWLLPKGAGAAQELAELPRQWNHMFHVEQSITDPGAGIIVGRLLGMKSATVRTDP